jgi:signal transduction histidine kinase
VEHREVGGEQLRRLQLVTDAALAHLRLDELLDALLARTQESLGVDTVAILMLEDGTDELVPRAALGLEDEVESGVRIPVGRGFAGTIVADRRPVVLPDVDHADVINPLLREKGIRTAAGVPLLIEGNPIGVLHVGSLTPREFTRGDVDLLQLVADRAAIAIEHARVYEAERAARRRLEDVQQVTDAALAHLELDELFTVLLARIRGILAADTVAVLLYDEGTRELVARAALGLEEEVEAGVRVPLGKGFAGRVAQQRRPIVLPDVMTADIHNPILREKGLKSMLGVPLLVRGDAIGVLHVGSLTPRTFDDAQIELLQLVAERAALAIERARIHEEIVRLDRLKLNFVAVASHELRTPATSIYGILATLRARRDTLPEETRAELEETLWLQADRLRSLIEQLLDLSQLDASAVQIDLRAVSLREVVTDVVRLVAHEEAGGAEVEVDVDPQIGVVADPHALERVLANVLANALRHGAPPFRIVSSNGGADQVRVAVEDAGPGIPPELVPRLFDRFERGGEGRGVGLGLAIAKTYAVALGGDLVYRPLERGSRFELFVPRAP